jgi:hypothetical protein
MNRKMVLSALFVVAAFGGNVHAAEEGNMLSQAVEFMKAHGNPMNAALPAVAIALSVRPVMNWIKNRMNKVEGNGLKELVGDLVGVEGTADGKYELGAHVGGLNAKVSTPSLNNLPFGDEERSVKELLHALTPRLEAGMDHQDSPLGHDSSENRMYAKVSLGSWSARLGCDVKDLLMVPAVMVAMHLASQYLPALPGSDAPAA